MKLQHEKFCIEYFRDHNAKAAAIRAGYSPKTAKQIGSKLLTRVDVSQRLKELTEAQYNKVKIDKDRVLRGLLRIADFDFGKLVDDEGRLLPIHLMPEDIRKALGGLQVLQEFEGSGKNKFEIGETVKFKVFDRARAWELIGRELGMFKEHVKHSGKVKLADDIREARKRAAQRD